MGKIIIGNSGSGGGASSDECTATKAMVLKGYKAVTADSGDEAMPGELELTGNAVEAYVLKGNTFYSTDPKTKRTGTMDVQSILSFSAAPYSSTQITFTWKNPAKGAFSGVIIVGKTGSYPTSITDGTRYYKGSGNNQSANGMSSVTMAGFSSGNTYYFRAFSYAIKNGAEWVHPTSFTAQAVTTKGQQVFTSSAAWTVPVGVRSIDVFIVGAGGSTYGRNNKYSGIIQSGAGGYTTTVKNIAVTPGQVFSVVVGAPDSAPDGNSSAGTPGVISYTYQRGESSRSSGGEIRTYTGYTRTSGSSSFGSYTALGGACGTSTGGAGRPGGSGSGSCMNHGSGLQYSSLQPGGTDGGDGGTTNWARWASSGDESDKYYYYSGGKGQGTTTKAFGEANGTLYASGGKNSGGTNADPNTGNGANGHTGQTSSKVVLGGSGIVIVRWGY